MTTKEIYLFKDEIYATVRELEKKVFLELSKKNNEINTSLTTFNEKVNSIIESNKSMIESITNQKVHFDKIKELDSEGKLINRQLATHKARIDTLSSDLHKILNRYEKMLKENIIISGYIGPGCNFKNLGDFAITLIKDIKKLKEEKKQLKNDVNESKAKMQLLMKNMCYMMEFYSIKIKDLKDNELESMLENKLNKINESTKESNINLAKTQNLIENKINDLGKEIEKINDNKININSMLNNKFEDIKKKEDDISEKLLCALKEVEEIQNIIKRFK